MSDARGSCKIQRVQKRGRPHKKSKRLTDLVGIGGDDAHGGDAERVRDERVARRVLVHVSDEVGDGAAHRRRELVDGRHADDETGERVTIALRHLLSLRKGGTQFTDAIQGDRMGAPVVQQWWTFSDLGFEVNEQF